MTTTRELVPGLAGVPAAESSISFIDGDRGVLEYRGISIQDLAENSTFEETSYLLLFGRLPTASELADFDQELRQHRRVKFRIIDLLKALPDKAHPMEALQSAAAALGTFYEDRNGADDASRRLSVIRLIAKLPTIVAAAHRIRMGEEPVRPRDDLGHAANFLWMLHEREPDLIEARTFDACLILHADHTMNASTFTARVVGATLADPYSVVAAAIGALMGPLHGGANERVLKLLNEMGSVENVAPHLEAMLARGERLMGFGHRVYKVKDPRAIMLQQLAERLYENRPRSTHYDMALELERVAEQKFGDRGIHPNVDFFSGTVYETFGIPPDVFTPVFAIARVSGWLAHWLEQMRNNRLFRPDQIYTGRHSVNYVPLQARALVDQEALAHSD
jgi:citrate synthase